MAKHRVLVPYDGSEFGQQIFPHIREFLPPEDNELILLRVDDRPQGRVGRPTRPASADANVPMYESHEDAVESRHPIYASQEMESALGDFEREIMPVLRRLQEEGYTVHTAVRFEESRGEAIVNYANSHEIDMVAMTTHWRTGINRLLFGSVTQYVAPRIGVPLLMVRPVEEDNGI